MRLLYLLFFIAILTLSLVVVIYSVTYVADKIHDYGVNTIINESKNRTDIVANLSKVDIYGSNQSLWDILNYILIVAYIMIIVGLFMHARKR